MKSLKSLIINEFFLYSILLFSLFIHSNSAYSIYYEKPSSARLAAASQKPPACTYQNIKYQHGQQVQTPEPCLNCTCRKGVLLCFLRVCPSLIQLNPNDNCVTVRESGQCCPTLKCEIIPGNDISNTTPNIPTTKSLSGFSQTIEKSGKTVFSSVPILTTETSLTRDNDSVHYYSDFKDLKASEKSVTSRSDNGVTVTQKDRTTTIFQTSPSTIFRESLLLVTSSPSSTLEDNEENLISISEGSCHLNGTVYAEGSAVISTSFCEYCYCIRSKRMCIRPRCHLSILGCLPRYTSEYACCPTSYVCGEEALTTLPMTTTTTTTTTTESVRLFARKAACVINGVEYKVGDPVATDQHCKQCYCSTGGVKKCKKIQCSPQMHGCVPVVPEGHCCPVEYKCNSTQEITKSSIDIEMTTNSVLNTDSVPTTTEQNIIDLTELSLNYNEVILRNLSTETDFEFNDSKFVDDKNTKNSSDSSFTDIPTKDESVTTSETVTPFDVTNNRTETILIQTENTINGQLLRSDDMILKIEQKSQNSSDKELTEKVNEMMETETSIELIIETTTNINPIDYISIDLNKNNTKSVLYFDNQTSNEMDITIETPTTVGIDFNPLVTTENNLKYFQNISIEKSDELSNFVKNISFESSKTSTEPTILMNENNASKQSDNETTFDSVGVILHGIIHAIDKQLQRRIPAEPRLKNNTVDDISEKKPSNDQNLKPMTYRSENKAGLPSLSSSFFITDDNEMPYKSDSDGVEIITAKTAFYDLHENPGDSILINLTPSSLKVSASPFNQNNNNTPKDKNGPPFDILGQNNRAAIYGRPANPFPQPYIQSNNNWKAVNSNFPRKPLFEETSVPSKPIESLYYNENNRRQDTDEILDQNNSDFDKRPRLEFESAVDPNRMKVIPFKVNDAVAGTSPKRKNGSFLIRVSTPNKNALTPDLSSKSNQQISCFFNNIEYPNGAMIPKSDPCTLCRCFYGRELCQQQKCPAPPEKDCVPEKMAGYCCPRYICRVIEETKLSPNQAFDVSIPTNLETQNSSPIRKTPQFLTENRNNFNVNNLLNDTNNENTFKANLPQNNENNFDDKNLKEENKKLTQFLADSMTASSRYTALPLPSTPKPFQRISGINSKLKPNENRIHFPNDNSKEIDSGISQPIITDSVSPLSQTNSRPSKPIISGSHHSQYNGGNKFRLKPSPTMTQSVPSLLPFGSPQMPNLRLPPFLLPSNNNNNGNTNIRHKTSTTSTAIPHLEDILTKSEIIKRNNISITDNNENILTVNTNESSSDSNYYSSTESKPLTPEYHSTSSTTESHYSEMSSTASSVRWTLTPTVIPSTSSTTITKATKTTVTPQSKPKVTQIIDLNQNQNQNQNTAQNTWDLLRVSGCNIYGTMYEIDAQIERLSTTCKKCICSVHGVKCNDIC